MKKVVDGKVVEMTAEEIAELEKQARLEAIEERSRPMTVEEVTAMLIPMQINTLNVDDNTALRMKSFYPEWASGVSYAVGKKVQFGGKLWRCIQAHTAMTGWEPSMATASLWEAINETHAGTPDDPIPYEGSMVLESGKHYLQDYDIYLCIRNSDMPVYHALKDLLGIYVTAV